jgi:hypothetical protein
MLRDNPVGSSHQCLENPRPAGAELPLTEDVTSPFQAEPRQLPVLTLVFLLLTAYVMRHLSGLKNGRCSLPDGRHLIVISGQVD